MSTAIENRRRIQYLRDKAGTRFIEWILYTSLANQLERASRSRSSQRKRSNRRTHK